MNIFGNAAEKTAVNMIWGRDFEDTTYNRQGIIEIMHHCGLTGKIKEGPTRHRFTYLMGNGEVLILSAFVAMCQHESALEAAECDAEMIELLRRKWRWEHLNENAVLA